MIASFGSSAIRCGAAVPPPATSYTTSFPGTENPLSDSGKWITGGTTGIDWQNPRTTPGLCFASGFSTGFDDNIAVLSPSVGTFSADQYAQGTLSIASGYTPGNSHECELLLRGGISAHSAIFYEITLGLSDGRYLDIVQWNGPVGDFDYVYQSGHGSGPPMNTGDVFRAEIQGTTMQIFRNASLILTHDVTEGVSKTLIPIASGNPGLGFYALAGGVTLASYGFSHYEAGDLSA
jgi:hypothetical protein